MSTRYAKCVQDAVAAGRISEAMARAINARVKELLAKGLDEASAMTRAAQDILAAAAEKKRQTAKRILAAARNVQLAEAHPAGFRDGVLALLARDLTGKATYSNVEGRARAIRGLAHAGLAEVLDRFRSKLLGLTRDEEGLTQMVRALYGETPKDPTVKALAEAWSRVTDDLVDRFIAAGGHPSTKRADWRLPQIWDRAKVVAEGREAFLRFMEDEHAAGRLSVRDPDTGQEVNPLRRAEIVSQAFERIRTEGLSDIIPGAAQGRGALANQRSAMRAFQWTSAEAWLAANERFGPGNRSLYDMLNGHIDGMARDIAMLEVLGPNPEWMVRYLRDETMRRMADQPEAAEVAAWRIDSVWAHVSGTAQTPVNEWVAAAFREVRAFLTATRLGSALLSSVSDFATMRQVSAWNGLPATGWMRDYLRLLNPANAEDRRIAVRAGLIAEAWAQRAVGAMRNQADVVGTGLGSRLADFVLRASGLAAHTQSARWAIGMEMLGHLADQAGRSLDQLDPALRQAMGRYGIGAAEWDLLRTHGVQDLGGWRVLSPEAVARGTRARLEAATRLLEFVQSEARFAVPEPGAAERSLMLGQTRPGTLAGEFLRSALQFKSFPVTVLLMHIGRGLAQESAAGKAAYLASFAIGTTLMGALAMQLKAIAQGRDPRAMDDHRFWGAAFVQGGGAGILGDFLYTSVNRADQSFIANTLGGPMGGLIDDLAKIAGLNIQALDDERRERAIGADLARFLRNNTPGTTLWYSRLATDRLLWDRLQWWADPEAPRRWRQLERRWLRDYDQEFWWAPGERAPRRGPEFGRAVGTGKRNVSGTCGGAIHLPHAERSVARRHVATGKPYAVPCAAISDTAVCSNHSCQGIATGFRRSPRANAANSASSASSGAVASTKRA